MYDTKLLSAAQRGDEAAFAALYDRNVEAVYDLCWALTGDEPEASRLVADVFVLAAGHLGQITDASQLRPWLLAIARHRVLAEDDEGTLHSGWGSDPKVDPVSDEPLGTADLRRWVRAAAATLALSDQLVVELVARHDLDGDQLAAAIGCDPSDLERVVTQVEREANDVLGALVVARQGCRDCPELAQLLEGWDGRPVADIADAVQRHTADCERCSRRWAVAAPLEALAAAPGVSPSPGLRNDVLDGIDAYLPQGATAGFQEPASTVAVVSHEPPPGGAGAAAAPVAVSTIAAVSVADDRPDPYPWAMIGAVAAAVVALAVALVLIFTSGHHSPVSAAARAGTSTPSPLVSAAPPTAPGTIVPIDTTSTSTSSTAALPPAGRLGLNAVQVDLGDSATSAQVILTNSGQASSGWQASSGAAWLTVRPAAGVLASGGSITISLLADRATAPAGTLRVRVSFTPSGTNGTAASLEVLGTNAPAATSTTTTPASAGPSITNVSANPSRLQASPCPGDQAQVSATVTDPLGVSSASVSYTPPGGTAQTAAMTQSGDRWSTTITASSSAGTLSYVVTATDSSGVTTNSPPHSITVGACVL